MTNSHTVKHNGICDFSMHTEIKRFKTAVNNVVDEVDKIYLRDLQADSHACAANCCRDKESPTQTLLQCVENCGLKLQKAQSIVLEEFNHLEDKFERCLSSCEEFAREADTVELKMVDSDMYNGCIRRCVDTNIEIIPDLFKAINNAFSKSS